MRIVLVVVGVNAVILFTMDNGLIENYTKLRIGFASLK